MKTPPPLPLCGAYPFVGYCGSFLNKLRLPNICQIYEYQLCNVANTAGHRSHGVPRTGPPAVG